MKLACSTLTFGKLAGGAEFEAALGSISNAGYRGVQVEYDLLPGSFMSQPEKVAELVREDGLECVAVAVTLNRDTASFTKRVDGKVGTLCLFERDFDTAAAKTKDLLEFYVQLGGISLSVQPHVRSNLESTQQLDEMLERCRPLEPTVCFDTAHLTALGVDLHSFIKKYGKMISIVHLKDLKARRPVKEIDYDRDFLDVGDGIVDFPRVLKSFRDFGYEGWYVVEVDHAQEKTVDASIRKNIERLSRLN